jgi:hypothetical protein
MYRFVYIIVALVCSLCLSARASAVQIQFPSGYTQSDFKRLMREAGAAIAYTPLAPAEPLGITGFDVGIEATVVDINENKPYWKNAVEDADVPSILVFPKVHVQKGLPFGVDVGLSYAKVPSSLIDLALIGGEIKWAVMKGGMTSPAVALRGSFSKLLGVDELDLQTYGADVSVSKGFGFLTPYAGVGETWFSAREKSSAVSLDPETVGLTRGFVGTKLSIFLVNFVGEAEISKIMRYSLRANLSF